ncbi:MAG: glucodextranase DOMON-like domain-containing protein [Pyrobaculum sp.]
MKSKYILLAIMLSVLIYAQGVFTVQKATDPTGDFKGPGWYIPPRDPMFKNGTVFDITGFEIAYNASADVFLVKISFADIGGNPGGSETGFSMQYIQVYIHRGFPGNPWGTVTCTILGPGERGVATGNAFIDEASGFFCPDPANLTQLKYTPAVKLSSDAPWDVAIFLGPKRGNETVNYIAVANVADGTITVTPLTRVYVDKNTVVAVVPRKAMPPTTRLMSDFPQPTWKYYVLVTPYDSKGPGKIADFAETAGGLRVGVGTANASSILAGTIPRVLDVLGPSGQLAAFSPQSPAVLSPVSPSWGNFPLAITTTTVGKIIPVTVTKTDTLTVSVTETKIETLTVTTTNTFTQKVIQPVVDPVSYVVLAIGVIAGLVGAVVAARRK